MDTKIRLDFKTNMMIISVVAFLTTLIGVSFAWLRSDLLNGSTTLFVGSAELSLTFHTTSTFTAYDLAPGEKAEKTFEIQNLGSTAQTFNILWKGVRNTLVDKNYFMYTIENVDTGEQLFYPKYLPTNSAYIASNISIPAATTYSYKLTVYYVDDPKYNQTQNSNLYFMGDIKISSITPSNTESLSIFVNGVHSDYLPTLSQYSIDTSRTFCTDGASIAKVNNSIQISNKTDTTTCELYLVSGSAAAITNDPYNLLIIDLGDSTLASVPEIKYRYSGDIIELGVPEKSGYAFLGWQVSGGGSSIVDNTKLRMGTTYTYVVPTWARGHWNKVIQTCTQGAPTSYTRTYKTCDANIDNYTKVEKTCGVSSWTKTTSVCGVTETTKKTFKCGRTSNTTCSWSGPSTGHFMGTCSTTSSRCTYSSDNGNTKITECTRGQELGENLYEWTYRYYTCSCTTTYSYSFPSTATTTSTVAPSECNAASPSCSTVTHYNNENTKITCTPKTYGWTSSTDTTSSTCTSSGSCSSSTSGNSYVTACTAIAYNFGSETTPATVATCTENLISCDSETNGQTNTACTPNYSYALSSTTTTDTVEACSTSSFTCKKKTVGNEYTTSCTPKTYDYGYIASTEQSSYCFVSSSHSTCSSSTNNQTYISTCELIDE